jgi:putative transposase
LKELVDEVDERKISITSVCEILGTNRKTYYNNLNREENTYKLKRIELEIKIKQIHDESKQIYGAPKITRKLRQQGETVSEKHVGNIMREMGLKPHYIKRGQRQQKTLISRKN